MYKVINGKRYNTDTAQLMGECSYGCLGDLDYTSEELYRKQTGEFFLYGEGGANSIYREEISMNSWSGGEQITPLSYAEAQKWAEEHLSGEEYDRIFGTVDDSDEKRTVAIRLTAGSAEKLKRLAAQAGTNASEVIEELIAKA